ncbi:MAG: alpha-amylase [Deltaproteobacteria bacterium]|nr:alpha-amylase [Deltaproteobacteria bacterium]
MPAWVQDALFYHLFPLGLCGAPRHNDFTAPPTPRLEALGPWLDQARDLGATALLLGPVWEATSHGYDTADFFQVDRRLGDNATLAWLAGEARQRGLKLVLDGVFHHVGRDFWAFRDVLDQGRNSRFVDWFYLDFQRRSPLGDPFAYETWRGHGDLVKLNLANPEVRGHLWEAVATWLREYHLDGLRLDAADHLPLEFLRDLAAHCRRLKPEFWLLGEVVKGDYLPWLGEGGLDAVTNYEAYKGLYSSQVDGNYFEIAYTLRRQCGEYGLYGPANLYNFLDNHDVARLASRLGNPASLYPAHALLFTMPGIPSLYYGSEFGVPGEKAAEHDWPLRPALDLAGLAAAAPQPDLPRAVARLGRVRAELAALRHGDYQQVEVGPLHLIFLRRTPESTVLVAVNGGPQAIWRRVKLPGLGEGKLTDRLNQGESLAVRGGEVELGPLWPFWARVLEWRAGR